MAEMTPRRQAVLGLVVRSYIENALPVGSKAVVTGYGLGLSPATIRNEMAALEELGYLTHPHTSAGRVPTEQGYRFFVEHLLGETELPLAERLMIRHQFHQARLQLDQWAHLAAAILAHTTRKAAVATPPRTHESQYKHLELLNIRDALVLLVLVLQGGTVKQQMLSLDEPRDQEALGRLANQLNEKLVWLYRGQIVARLEEFSPLAQGIARVVVSMMSAEDAPAEEMVYWEGLAHMMAEPEFAEAPNVRQMVHVLEGRALVDVIMSAAHPLDVGGVQVLIGTEGRRQDLGELSLVFSRYGVRGGATGLLGVVGPIRQPYDRTIGAVRYVGQLLTDLVSDWYGGGEPISTDSPD